MATRILGISAYYHDSAACLVVDGEIVAAAQEERFTRRKHDAGFPARAVHYCLEAGNIGIDDVNLVGFYEKPLLKFERLLETYVDYAPHGLRSYMTALPSWLSDKLWLEDVIRRELRYEGKMCFGEHHESHAASAFYPSPFEEAAIITMDGVGEWATSSIGLGRGSEIQLLKELHFPHSVGLLYSAFTYFTGFKVNSGEYKLMGLAPYGEPRYVSEIRDHLADVREDGSIRLNMEYFDYCHGLTMTGAGFERLFGGPPRAPEAPVTQREMDLARSIQQVTEDIMLKMARHAKRETGMAKLCLAGGVALNCVGNGRLLREADIDAIWIQPAAGDAGGAVGVALALWHRYLGQPRTSAERAGTWKPTAARTGQEREAADCLTPYTDGMKGAFLGPSYSDDEIAEWVAERGHAARRADRRCLPAEIARFLADGAVIGLFQGRMEFGPRALGARSIIGDPRSPTMQSVMNLKIKFRESFRPFAPAVLREHVGRWFELDQESPYMLLVADLAAAQRIAGGKPADAPWPLSVLNTPRSTIPAVTHVDNSARIQTVRREANPFFYEIIRAFHDLTGCPVVINTSFNVRGEPIVCTPDDAYRCFARTKMDVLVLESFILEKRQQARIEDHAGGFEFEPD